VINHFQIQIKLLSDTTFGRGDGLAGVVDAEVQHDNSGLPYFGGRALRGVLRDECCQLLHVLNYVSPWVNAAEQLFGVPGSDGASRGLLQIGDAQLLPDLRAALTRAVQRHDLSRSDVLESLTTIRRQTAIDPKTGVAKRKSLRASRVVLRELIFTAEVTPFQALDEQGYEIALLAACVQSLRRLGTGRTRGRGQIICTLRDDADKDITSKYFEAFATAVQA